MRVAGKSLILTMLLAAAGLLAAQTPGLDPGVQAKANAGDAAAEVQMGEHFEKLAANEQDPESTPGDYKQAVAWYEKAAEKGYVDAELHLATLYRDGGTGFPRDMAQAAAWYRKAADQGDVGAQGTLGLLYSMGQGVQQDPVEGYFWLELASSVPGPKQQQFAANEKMIGMQLTEDDVQAVRLRVMHWKAAHPQAAK